MVATAQPISSQCWNPAPIGRICLECAAIFRHLPLTVRCRLGDYTTAMMIRHILTIGAAVAAGSAATSLALAQGYSVPPGAVYSTAPAPAPYPPGGYPADYRRAPGAPDFDALEEEDDAPNAQSSTALPPPGPILSPSDPRYGRPAGPPVYTARGAPTGPILSPDDPRYGRLDGSPPVIYSDRPAGPPQQSYPDRGSSIPTRTIAAFVRPRASGLRVRSRERCSLPWAPTAGRRCCPRCRRMNSRKSLPRNSRRICAARKSLSRPRSRRER